jgi:hypothetical protein
MSIEAVEVPDNDAHMVLNGRLCKIVTVVATVKFSAFVFADNEGDVIVTDHPRPVEPERKPLGHVIAEEIADAVEWRAVSGHNSHEGTGLIAMATDPEVFTVHIADSPHDWQDNVVSAADMVQYETEG